jgi:very-short-patch-repair endonuclease
VTCAASKPTPSENCGWNYAPAGSMDSNSSARFQSDIADFMCFECKLIVELDGSQHLEQVEYDEARSRWLETQGYRVVRYWNIDVLLNTERVMEEIWSVAEARRPGRRT